MWNYLLTLLMILGITGLEYTFGIFVNIFYHFFVSTGSYSCIILYAYHRLSVVPRLARNQIQIIQLRSTLK